MKYPRTWHFHWSKSLQNDDRKIPDESCFENKMLVYTEKLDGECTACSRNNIHARSEEKYNESWQSYMKKFYSCFCHDIPENMIIFGECLSAIHSIEYTKLPTCFFVFGILENDQWLSWDDVINISRFIGLDTVPEITKSNITNLPIPKESFFGPICEGYVARNILFQREQKTHRSLAYGMNVKNYPSST